MKRMLTALTSLLALTGMLLVTLTFTAPAAEAAPAKAVNGAVVKKRLVAMVTSLPVRAETPRGYARSKFRHWVDANGDCQSTRHEVLVQESRTRVTGRCTITRGTWFSYYDRRTVRVASNLDIDHLVALKEAWDSGAKAWGAQRRTAFANDLADKRVLVAVSASVNRSKQDRDPAQWLPRFGKCRYVKEWTATKVRWGLKVDQRERTVLLRHARRCGNPVVTVRRAVVKPATTSGGSTGGTTGGSTGGGLDPRFGTRSEATSRGYGPYVRGRDPEYSWYRDSDSDGVVCE